MQRSPHSRALPEPVALPVTSSGWQPACSRPRSASWPDIVASARQCNRECRWSGRSRNWCDRLGGSETRTDIVADVVRIGTELQSTRAVDLDVEVGSIDLLLYMSIDDTRYRGDTAPHLFGNAVILDAVIPDRARVDLRGKPKIQNLRRHVGGLEIEQVFREGRRQHLAQFADIICGRGVAVIEGHHNPRRH